MRLQDQIRLLHTANALALTDLGTAQQRHGIDLGLVDGQPTESRGFYVQFAAAIRAQAAEMARHYEVFYCLETSIRATVRDQLRGRHGDAWWSLSVPTTVQENVTKNMNKERDAGVTVRSSEPIDYTTFGELGEIIRSNWDVFGAIFVNERAVSRILAGLNLLRAPIAHSNPLAEDEVVRLELAVRDWFRQMGSG